MGIKLSINFTGMQRISSWIISLYSLVSKEFLVLTGSSRYHVSIRNTKHPERLIPDESGSQDELCKFLATFCIEFLTSLVTVMLSLQRCNCFCHVMVQPGHELLRVYQDQMMQGNWLDEGRSDSAAQVKSSSTGKGTARNILWFQDHV